MGKPHRLTKVLEKARRIEFSNKDRLVFFSDIHRGNNSWADEFARNENIYYYALQYYFEEKFTYVEVGDGDELLKFKYIEPIRIAHEDVYRLLQKFNKKKRLHYIFGNHDFEYSNSDLVHHKLNKFFNGKTEKTEILFDDFEAHEGLVFHNRESGLDLLAVHGHQADDLFHRMIRLNRVLLRLLWRPLQLMGLQDPGSVSQNYYKRQKVEEALIEWSAANTQPLICGHTHKERFPKNAASPYFNVGSVVHPRYITCIEIEDGAISLVRWRIKPGKKGVLHIKRDEIEGPEPLSNLLSGEKLKDDGD